MSSSEKELRKALEHIVHNALEPTMRAVAREALDASETTDLERLRERVESFRDELRKEVAACHWANERDQGYFAAMRTVLDLIGRQGCGESEN